MTLYTVRLNDDTVGSINSDTLDGQSAYDFIGDTVRVKLHDENGNLLEIDGILIEILDEIKQ
jgi:hypothetical protein